jgi:beta-glucosidase
VLYSEDIYVGYRYYEKIKVKPLFGFGYGLSYTIFCLSGLAVSQPLEARNRVKEEVLEVSVSVENIGSCSGAETVQIYIYPPTHASISRPVRELKGFKKVKLQQGEKQEVMITIPIALATSFWDERQSAWLSEAGEYTVTVVGTGEQNVLSTGFVISRTREWKGLFEFVTPAASQCVNGNGE